MSAMTDVDVGIGQRPPPRSPDLKAAIEYLVASGATAISITESDGACTFRIGTKIDPNAVAIHWLNTTLAPSIVTQARRDGHPVYKAFFEELRRLDEIKRNAFAFSAFCTAGEDTDHEQSIRQGRGRS